MDQIFDTGQTPPDLVTFEIAMFFKMYVRVSQQSRPNPNQVMPPSLHTLLLVSRKVPNLSMAAATATTLVSCKETLMHAVPWVDWLGG